MCILLLSFFTIHPSIHPSIHLSLCLSVSLSLCLSLSLSQFTELKQLLVFAIVSYSIIYFFVLQRLINNLCISVVREDGFAELKVVLPVSPQLQHFALRHDRVLLERRAPAAADHGRRHHWTTCWNRAPSCRKVNIISNSITTNSTHFNFSFIMLDLCLRDLKLIKE